MPFLGLGVSPARFRYFWAQGWDVPLQYKLLTRNGHFPGLRGSTARFPYFWALTGMCLFSTSFLLQMAISGPGRLSGQIPLLLDVFALCARPQQNICISVLPDEQPDFLFLALAWVEPF